MDDGNGKSGSAQDNNFTVNGSKAVSRAEISIGELMRICFTENDRRCAGYDHRLCRPTTMPDLVRFALRFVRSGSIRPTGGHLRNIGLDEATGKLAETEIDDVECR